MNMMNVLFNPQGCVRGRSYWVGCAVLLGLAIAVQLIGYYVIMTAKGMQGMIMGSVFSMVLWLFIFPYFCLYGKRLHDVGVSATWFYSHSLYVRYRQLDCANDGSDADDVCRRWYDNATN